MELLSVLSASDSVELKLTVPESQQRSTVAALGMDPLDAQIRQVVFFDTPDLALDKGGVVVRARRVQGKGDDSVVKLRPVVPSELSDSGALRAGIHRGGGRGSRRVRLLRDDEAGAGSGEVGETVARGPRPFRSSSRRNSGSSSPRTR